MTERVFQVMKNGILQYETNLNPGDGVFLSSAAEAYVAHLGASAPADVEEVVGQMNVEYELGELPTEPEPVIIPDEEVEEEVEEVEEVPEEEVEEPVEVTEEELEADEAVEGYEAWTVLELQDELRNRDLAVSGSKAELVARLEEDDAADEG